MKLIRTCSLCLCILALGIDAGPQAFAQAAAPAAAPAAPAPPPSAAELKDAAAKAPTTDQLKAGDPGGSITGTINDVPAIRLRRWALRLADVANQVGQNKIAINFVWTLVTGFLVMFMQAGFAMVEAGLCRVKNANHTYMMNFFVYGCGLLAYWLIGFAIQMGGVGRQRKPGRPAIPEPGTQPDLLRQGLGHLRRSRECSSPATPMTWA